MRHPIPWTASAFLAALANAGMAAAASTASPPAVTKEQAPCESDRGARIHDGFFARSEPGIAHFWAQVSDSGAPPRRSSVRGLGQSGGISIGGTPAKGLVLGGTAWTARIDPVFVEGGETVNPDDDSIKVTLLRVGPFVDWYPDPTRGFHAFGSLAFTLQIESDLKGDPLEPAALGASLSVGPGYEWFLSSELSLGILGRMALGLFSRPASDGDERTLFVIPELALSATYH